MRLIRRITQTFLSIIAFLAVYQAVIRLIRRRYHFPAPAPVGRFLDSNYRRAIQPPGPIIERSGIRPGMRVLEVGCGSGAYTTFVARAVGPSGEVNALDIQPAMLAQIERKLARPENQDLTNIRLYEGSAYELPFEDSSMDVVYMITVLQEIPDRAAALRETHRVLRPGGFLAVTEFLPDPDYAFPASVVHEGRQAGFALDDLLGNLWTYTARLVKSA